jgi:hypothetical protein
MRMAEPHTLTFLFTKRRITDGQAVRRGRGSARSGGLPPGSLRAALREPFLGVARSRLGEARWEAALEDTARS